MPLTNHHDLQNTILTIAQYSWCNSLIYVVANWYVTTSITAEKKKKRATTNPNTIGL